MGRNVRISSLGLTPGYERAADASLWILEEMEKAAQDGADLILTPEVWSGQSAAPKDGGFHAPVLDRAAEIAAQYHTYISVCMERYLTEEEEKAVRTSPAGGFWSSAKRLKHNSQFLLDRNGEQVYIYDKLYPYPPEFNESDGAQDHFAGQCASAVKEEAVVPGDHIGVFDCDFGRIGLAICFDMNFPKVWEAMAGRDVELVIWPAAFSGGRNAALRAGTYHYYVATCTSIGQGDCRAADINGDWLMVKYPEEGRAVNRADISLDLDRTIFHKNYNEAGIAQIEKDYAGRVNVDRSLYYEEEWIVLSSEEKDLIRALCEEYGLVPLRQFKMHAMPEYIDARRCETIVK